MAKKNKFGINEAAALLGVFAIGLHFSPGALWNHISFVCGIIAGALLGNILTVQAQKKIQWDKEKVERKRKENLTSFTIKELEEQIKKRSKTTP